MLGVVQSALLLVGTDAQRDDAVHNKIEGITEGEDPNHNPDQRDEVTHEYDRIAVNQSHFFGKNPSEYHAHQSANTVTCKYVQGVVDGKTRLEPNGPIADQ